MTEQMGNHVKGSFRDPAGYVYRDDKGTLLRKVTAEGLADFDAADTAGVYDELIEAGLLVPHKLVGKRSADGLTLAPKEVPVISYPFEWSFTMLKDAALATLEIQRRALAKGVSLKDASAYNIQFVDGKPQLIDTLSFEAYAEGKPWVAYGQFCRHFLAPLTLMAFVDIRLGQLSRDYIDGVPLDLAAKLLPRTARLRPSVLMHIVLHSKAQDSKGGEHKTTSTQVTKRNLLAIIESLERTVRSLGPKVSRTEWADYYQGNTNYTETAAAKKRKLVASFASAVPKLKTAIDFGGNDGHYSRVFSELGASTICADIDPFAVEANYRRVRSQNEEKLLPLLVDLTNPGGALGWANQEREALHERIRTDAVMALALIHHLAISNNLPLDMIAEYFSRFGGHLIIEFVPKKDSQVEKLLATRKDVFPHYDEKHFEQAFGSYYQLVKREQIAGTKRTLYLFKRKKHGSAR